MKRALFESVDALNAHPELFYDPNRPESDNQGPFLIVHDDFYSNPYEIRRLALSHQFFQYKPPLASQVGDEIASQYPDKKPVWLSSSLLRYLGKVVKSPECGYRHATPEVRQALAGIIGEDINTETWREMGDWWNGAFHLQFEAGESVHRVIHHHYRKGDVSPRGWSGLVYLSPDAPARHGTTIWREKSTQRFVASMGDKYDQDVNEFDLALSIENRFNRLVLFRENVLHRAGHGFGNTPDTSRLMQTFFFESEVNG